jgi:protein TonB
MKKYIFALLTLISISFTQSVFAQEGTSDKDKKIIAMYDSETIPIAEHYEGGKDALVLAIHEEMKYPIMARKSRTQGKCIVHLKLEADGTTSNFRVVKNQGATTGEEARRVVETLKFNAPGYDIEYNIPVIFKL